jgi:hypothetical protein
MFCCVTTPRCKRWTLARLGRSLDPHTARTFGLGVLGFDFGSLTTFGLPSRCLPATHLLLALGFLAVALVPAPRPILASTPFAQADPRTRLPRSGRMMMPSRNVVGAQGRVVSQGKARGERANVLPGRYQNANETGALV